MPTYEYRCLQCQDRFDVFQKMSDAAITKCPKCAGPVERLMGAGLGLIFKGSGFYITDYKKSNSSTSTASSTNSAGTKSEAPKTETKPAETKSTESKSTDKSDKAAA
jgi:putative FmdB family regulatory protein